MGMQSAMISGGCLNRWFATPQMASSRPLSAHRYHRSTAPVTTAAVGSHRVVALPAAVQQSGLRPAAPARESTMPGRSNTSVYPGYRTPIPDVPVSSRSCRRVRNVPCSAAVDPLVPLGYDFLTFLAATVLVVPLFKRAKVSPVLGFLFAGIVLNQLGLFRSVEEIEKLGELGVLFLLFEQGLELTVDRLKVLSTSQCNGLMHLSAWL
mmetsp:Transcript_11327/g.32144  ORF Transcript_11327/g.32144 Transcript_11327/m.32144 type:complete len:208 (-) Transcript_11327:547-1170(-)